MEFQTIVTAVGSLGFPIVACIALGLYVKYITDQANIRMDSMQKEHKEEVTKMTEALQNNTLAIQRLCDKLDKEGD